MKKNNKTIAKETIGVIEDGFTTEKIIHQGYQEYEQAKKKHGADITKFKLRQCFEKWQYIFKKGTLRISLIKVNILPHIPRNEGWFWEIYADDDKRLFHDTQRFKTKAKAMKTIRNLLGD